jgi:gamma-glutamylaminecyclotransferase
VSSLLFVYGTLKRGGCNHRQLADQTFVGEAQTEPGFELFDLGGYPGIAAVPGATTGVSGEVWSVTAAGWQHLDEFEGVATGLYRRASITLQPPFAHASVAAYFPVQDPSGHRAIGSTWKE